MARAAVEIDGVAGAHGQRRIDMAVKDDLAGQHKQIGFAVQIYERPVGGEAGRRHLNDDGRQVLGQKVGGGPSVLYDAVAVVPSAAGAELLAGDAQHAPVGHDVEIRGR